MENIIVACRPFARQRQRNKQRNNTVNRQQILNKQQLDYKNEERCFLCGPCQGVINGTSLEFSQSIKRRLGRRCEMAASLGVRELKFNRCEPLLLEAGS
jgi:hypothetical protein